MQLMYREDRNQFNHLNTEILSRGPTLLNANLYIAKSGFKELNRIERLFYSTTKDRVIHQVPIHSLSLYGKRSMLGILAS